MSFSKIKNKSSRKGRGKGKEKEKPKNKYGKHKSLFFKNRVSLNKSISNEREEKKESFKDFNNNEIIF